MCLLPTVSDKCKRLDLSQGLHLVWLINSVQSLFPHLLRLAVPNKEFPSPRILLPPEILSEDQKGRQTVSKVEGGR